jgi:outer membrane lipoprotein-sorting protein
MPRYLLRPVFARRWASSLLIACVLFGGLFCGPLVSRAWAVLPVSLTEGQQQLIKKAEQKLTSVSSLRATFEQMSSNGGSAAGSVMIKRPGKMRLDYLPPTQVQIIANGSHLIYIDKELDQVSYLSLESTPAGILLREKVSFSDPDIAVTGVQELPDAFEINVIMRQDPGAGALTLVFDRKSFELTQWRMRDAQGVVTSVVLHDVTRNVTLDDSLFHFAAPIQPMRQN